jgi:rhodanese-related sulfurtransferase
VKHLLPRQAHEFLLATPEALFIDCRSDAEFFLVGHPLLRWPDGREKRPEHVLWADELRMEDNPNFTAEVAALAVSKEQPIVLICRSGRRTLAAAEALEAQGFKNVVNILHGFEGDRDDRDQRSRVNGWRFEGLDWEQM